MCTSFITARGEAEEGGGVRRRNRRKRRI